MDRAKQQQGAQNWLEYLRANREKQEATKRLSAAENAILYSLGAERKLMKENSPKFCKQSKSSAGNAELQRKAKNCAAYNRARNVFGEKKKS